MGAGAVSDSFAASGTLFLILDYLRCEGRCLDLLQLDMLCLVDIPGKPVLFRRETEEEWVEGRGLQLGIIYDRRIN